MVCFPPKLDNFENSWLLHSIQTWLEDKVKGAVKVTVVCLDADILETLEVPFCPYKTLYDTLTGTIARSTPTFR